MEPGQTTRLVSAGTSAAIAITLFNPTEVIKTQMQSSSASLTMREVASKVWKKDGARGFWAGVRPNVVRTFLVNGAEIGTYDESKLVLIESAGDGLAWYPATRGDTQQGVVNCKLSSPEPT
ncbi:PUMP3 [Symbiodinium natans]|uniref:PUMP3 protein n=1 Tax=Symbiodinium natans TaxID=878477 RepID=A0A812TN13_9DINO|nr:PUMP3 [Symbiodinium natans]